MIAIRQRYRQTDRQTDGRHARSISTLHAELYSNMSRQNVSRSALTHYDTSFKLSGILTKKRQEDGSAIAEGPRDAIQQTMPACDRNTHTDSRQTDALNTSL